MYCTSNYMLWKVNNTYYLFLMKVMEGHQTSLHNSEFCTGNNAAQFLETNFTGDGYNSS